MNGNRASLWFGTVATLTCLILATGLSRASDSGQATPGYSTGLANAQKIAGELHHALDDKYQRQVHPQIIMKKGSRQPWIYPCEIQTDQGSQKTVALSEACLTLINQISHAKAISESDRGYFKRYMIELSSVTGESPLPSLSKLPSRDAWSLDTVNRQVSHFNQMMGALIAIDRSHHYLGHYKKYADEMKTSSGQPKPINQFLSKREWRAAVLRGARNALDCGLGVDGLKALFEGIDDMPKRPSWTVYFLPEKAKVSKITRDLDKLEKNFFLAKSGDLKPESGVRSPKSGYEIMACSAGLK